jgi:hypothetical protein
VTTAFFALGSNVIVNLVSHAGRAVVCAWSVCLAVGAHPSVSKEVLAATDATRKRRWFASLAVLVLCLSGCGSLASRRLFPEINARHTPPTALSEIIELLPGLVETSAIVIRADGTAAVVTVDSDHQLHYMAVANHGVIARETLGTVWNGSRPRLEIIEHRGQLRVLAGDKQFTRGASQATWKETLGNRCAKFLALDDALFCAMVIKGEEIKSPQRKDWTVGWFILFPVVFWSNTSAAKLVIAQELPEGWLVRAVIDGESPLDADLDFLAATDQSGQLQLLYSASRGGGLFAIGAGLAPGAFAAGYSGFASELRYAQFSLRELMPNAIDASPSNSLDGATRWLTRSSLRLENAPFASPRDPLHPLNRRFSVSPASGVVHGLLWAREMTVPFNSLPLFFGGEGGWVEVQLRDGGWNPRVDVVAVEDLPDATFAWAMEDRFAVIANNADGTTHALLESCSIGLWDSTCRLTYFVRISGQWSAPLILGSSKFGYDGRAIAVGDRGCAFATWVTADAKYVGRWIGACAESAPTQ